MAGAIKARRGAATLTASCRRALGRIQTPRNGRWEGDAGEAVDLEWQRRFSAHPETHQRWRELGAAFQDYPLRSKA